MSTIRLRRGSGTPSAGSFLEGEPAWDSTNGKLYIKNAAGAMVEQVATTATQTLTNKTLGDLSETVYTITDGASVDLNPANGPLQLWTLGANRTATASSFAAGESMLLMVADGTAYTLTWPTMTWVGGTAPTLATSGYTVVELWKISTTLYGAHVGDVA